MVLISNGKIHISQYPVVKYRYRCALCNNRCRMTYFYVTKNLKYKIPIINRKGLSSIKMVRNHKKNRPVIVCSQHCIPHVK